MARIEDNIVGIIGRTPLVRLNSICRDLPGNIVAKLEFQNPMRSIKDRAAHAMIETAEMTGQLKKGATVIEATSGNTGIALAFVCAAKGYPLIITMPEFASDEKKQMLENLGATVHLTPTKKLMKGAIDKAVEIYNSLDSAFMPMQFENSSNPKSHFDFTGPEIWNDTDGEISCFVAGVGTGGTITGVGSYLKARRKSIHIVAVEPSDSAVLSGKEPGPHKIQGIGAGFIPNILDRDVLDEIITVEYEEARNICRQLARTEGILVGMSSGANLTAALKIASREAFQDKLIVTVLCDTGERYLSTGLFKF